MAFDLKRVLKVMLFASGSPLTVKDIHTAITRFHEQASALPLGEPAAPETPADGLPVVPAESGEVIAPEPMEDDEMYRGVPALITTAQIREAMETITLELQAAGSEVLLVEGSTGWRLGTPPRFARWGRPLR